MNIRGFKAKIIQNNDGEFVVKVKIPEFDPFNLYSWELGVTEEELLISDFRELVKNYLKGDNELGAVSVLTKWIVGNIELSINQIKDLLANVPEEEFINKDYLRIVRNGNVDKINDVREVAKEDYYSEE